MNSKIANLVGLLVATVLGITSAVLIPSAVFGTFTLLGDLFLSTVFTTLENDVVDCMYAQQKSLEWNAEGTGQPHFVFPGSVCHMFSDPLGTGAAEITSPQIPVYFIPDAFVAVFFPELSSYGGLGEMMVCIENNVSLPTYSCLCKETFTPTWVIPGTTPRPKFEYNQPANTDSPLPPVGVYGYKTILDHSNGVIAQVWWSEAGFGTTKPKMTGETTDYSHNALSVYNLKISAGIMTDETALPDPDIAAGLGGFFLFWIIQMVVVFFALCLWLTGVVQYQFNGPNIMP